MILFVASDRRELEPFIAHWTQAKPFDLRAAHWACKGIWRNREVAAIAIGVAQPLVCDLVPAAICSIGTAGALIPRLQIGDVIVASSVRDEAGQAWPAQDPHGPSARTGVVLTSPHIARTAAEKRKLSASGAIIVEMEAAGLARSAAALDVPFYCIRAVSDLSEESFFIDFECFLKPNGTFNVPRLVMHALSHPVKGLGELLRLQRRTALAAKNLGDYLNACEF